MIDEIVTGPGTSIDHLPSMTDAEFRAYMAASQAVIAANHQLYMAGFAAGVAAARRGTPHTAFPPTGSGGFRNAMFRSGWDAGWASVHEDDLTGADDDAWSPTP
jgi:hypothetical protein